LAVEQRNTLVVGASSSIGPFLVDAFQDRGDQVFGTVHSGTADNLDSHSTIDLNLLEPSSLDSAMETLGRRAPELDVVVFLAGILPGISLVEYNDRQIIDVMTVNIAAQAGLIRRLLPRMANRSHIVMTSSISAERGSFDPIYAASKAAVVGLVKSLAGSLAPNVRINALSPGLIENSGMCLEMPPERRAMHRDGTPTRRLTSISEVARAILSITESAWSNLNGEVISLNGGAHVRV
jgi:3-oxoacyl-[acyl-carrier protein] reductase